jgi:integrase
LRGKARAGELRSEKTFRDAAVQFEREFQIITDYQRNATYVKGHGIRLRLHLLPFFGDMGLSEITPGQVQEYRIYRHEEAVKKYGKPPRAQYHAPGDRRPAADAQDRRAPWMARPAAGSLRALPRLGQNLAPRLVFSGGVQEALHRTRERARNPKNPRYKWESEQLHDYVLFMANTGLRPDEANRLEYRDMKTVTDEGTKETILEIEVRGKRGVGYCKSVSGAVRPFERLVERNNPQPTNRIFPKTHRELFNTILEEEGLKKDREGRPRTADSLRHTYICLRLMEGADIYQIAKNCRTSVEMIEKYYASHLKNTLAAAAINVMRKKAKKTKRLQDEEE